jgi:hypothetical protein
MKNNTSHPPEIDFAVIADARLILGEAKKNDRFANQRREERRKLGRLHDAARDLTADDVCLVLQQRLVISDSAGVMRFAGGGLAAASPV